MLHYLQLENGEMNKRTVKQDTKHLRIITFINKLLLIPVDCLNLTPYPKTASYQLE